MVENNLLADIFFYFPGYFEKSYKRVNENKMEALFSVLFHSASSAVVFVFSWMVVRFVCLFSVPAQFEDNNVASSFAIALEMMGG